MVTIILKFGQVVNTFFRIGRQADADEFRGAAYDLTVSRIILSNCSKFSRIILPQVPAICQYAEKPQIILDNPAWVMI